MIIEYVKTLFNDLFIKINYFSVEVSYRNKITLPVSTSPDKI